jgi:hypothetical protein
MLATWDYDHHVRRLIGREIMSFSRKKNVTAVRYVMVLGWVGNMRLTNKGPFGDQTAVSDMERKTTDVLHTRP